MARHDTLPGEEHAYRQQRSGDNQAVAEFLSHYLSPWWLAYIVAGLVHALVVLGAVHVEDRQPVHRLALREPRQGQGAERAEQDAAGQGHASCIARRGPLLRAGWRGR